MNGVKSSLENQTVIFATLNDSRRPSTPEKLLFRRVACVGTSSDADTGPLLA